MKTRFMSGFCLDKIILFSQDSSRLNPDKNLEIIWARALQDYAVLVSAVLGTAGMRKKTGTWTSEDDRLKILMRHRRTRTSWILLRPWREYGRKWGRPKTVIFEIKATMRLFVYLNYIQDIQIVFYFRIWDLEIPTKLNLDMLYTACSIHFVKLPWRCQIKVELLSALKLNRQLLVFFAWILTYKRRRWFNKILEYSYFA